MKKNVKVFEIKGKAVSGNDRTVHSVVSLDMTLADVCKAENIPMLSIVSTSVTAPMTLDEAAEYLIRFQTALVLDPNITIVKTRFNVYAA